jgi:hypothetical protein
MYWAKENQTKCHEAIRHTHVSFSGHYVPETTFFVNIVCFSNPDKRYNCLLHDLEPYNLLESLAECFPASQM